MARRSLNKLTDTAILRMKKPGFHSDGGNLYLRIIDSGAKRWVFRYEVAGRMRDIGLGSYDNDQRPLEKGSDGQRIARSIEERVKHTTGQARAAALHYRALLARGIDPAAARTDEKAAARAKDEEAQKATTPAVITFDAAAATYISIHCPAWKNAKHLQQWQNTLKTYASPIIGHIDVAAIDRGDIIRVLAPIWTSKTETATRVRSRLENILDWAKVEGHRTAENPARWKAGLEHSLPAPAKVRTVRNHMSLAHQRVPGFIEQLRQRPGIDAKALEFLILTVVRTTEALGAEWVEFDLDKSLWKIPARRMKAGELHEVPLSGRAVDILTEMDALRHHSPAPHLVFPGQRKGQPLSSMACLMLLRRMKVSEEATTHGFRSSFKSWAADNELNRLAVETCLAHKVTNKVEAAYLRTTLLEPRRRIMQSWADYCAGNSNVVSICREAS